MTQAPSQLGFTFHGPEPPPAPATPRRNLVIEAGAGTGKTTAIVGEVLSLLLGDAELSPERIVLVTFTEKAAGEIADRIHEALSDLELAFESTPSHEEIAWPIGSAQPLFRIAPLSRDAYARACVAQLARIDSLRSQTIHSFCQTLLRQYPLEAGLDPQFRIIEGFERSLLYDELYDDWLDRDTRVQPTDEHVAEWDFILNHLGYLFAIKDVIFSMLDRRDLLRESAHGLGDLGEVEPELSEAIDDIRLADESVVDTLKDLDAQRIYRHIRRIAPPRGGTLAQWIAYFEPIAASLRLANLPKGKATAELASALKVLRTSSAKGKSIFDRLSSHRAAVTLMSMTTRFAEFLDEEKRKLGVVDFDDLLLRTVTLLDDEAVAERVRAQYDYVFVDEFQDTDRVQARIIERLGTDRNGDWEPGKTILVGDPKQSIYGFRRADPETYYRMRETLRRHGAEVRPIVDQYRSDAPLVDAINAIFGCLFPQLPHDPNVFRPPYTPLRAARTKQTRTLDARLTFLHAEHLDRADRYFAEAEAVGQWILAHREESGGDLRRFAILFRRLTQIDDYLDTFERLGIDYVLPPTRFFLDRAAAVDLLAVLRAIAYPFDLGAEISAARTPYFALTDDEIATSLVGERSATYQAFAGALGAHRAAARQLTVSGLIARMVESAEIERFYAATADGPRALRHLEHVRSIAFAYDLRSGGSVSQFVDEITHRRSEPDEVEPSLIDDSRNAVRILSVHAAKGLEFETVILPDLAFRSSSSSEIELYLVEEPASLVMRGRASSLSAHFRVDERGEPLKKIGAERDAAELRRLFYVAVTRAKSDVLFVCNTTSLTSTGFWKCITDSLGLDKNVGVHWTVGAGRLLETLNAGGVPIDVAFEKMPAAAEGSRRRRRLVTPELETTVGALALGELAIAAREVAPAMLPGDAAIGRAGAKNRAAGIALHRVLELWDGGAETIDPLTASIAREQGLDAATLGKVKAWLATIARSAVFARLQAAETVARELPVWSGGESGVDGRRIDRLLREEGGYLVVDYKSGRPSAKRLGDDRAQVAAYCAAVAKMTGSACKGLLWYIDLDRDEAIEVGA